MKEHLEVGSEPLVGYRLRELRGRGGFAQVWEASAPDGQLVALKFIDAKIRDAFREVRSIQAIGQLSHRNLLATHRTWSLPGYIVVAMDLADGTLLDLLDAFEHEYQSALPFDYLLPHMEQAAEVIDFLNVRQHQLSSWVVSYQHCDIKPSNFMLLDGKLKLADFGLATSLTTSSARCSRVGTVAFAAPEVFHGNLSERSDQFSLAVTYYMLRTGRMPYSNMPTTFDRCYIHPEPDLSGLTSSEQPVIRQALSQHMADRWPSCVAMAHALRTAG